MKEAGQIRPQVLNKCFALRKMRGAHTDIAKLLAFFHISSAPILNSAMGKPNTPAHSTFKFPFQPHETDDCHQVSLKTTICR